MKKYINDSDLVAIIKNDKTIDGLQYYYHILKDPREANTNEGEYFIPSSSCLYVLIDEEGELWMTLGEKGRETQGYNDEHIWFEEEEVTLYRCSEICHDDEDYEDPIFIMKDIYPKDHQTEMLNEEFLELQETAYQHTKKSQETSR